MVAGQHHAGSFLPAGRIVPMAKEPGAFPPLLVAGGWSKAMGDGVRLCQTAQLWVNRAFIFIKAAIPTQGFFGHCRVSPGLLADLA